MHRKHREQGATLIELIVAVVLTIIAVVYISLIFPKTSMNITNNRRKMFANNLAFSRVQELKTQPYALIPLTPAGDIGAANCDCSQDNFAGIVVDTGTPFVEDSVTYVRKICVHLVNRNASGTWDSACPNVPLDSTTDKGLKNIRVRVTYGVGSKTTNFDLESMAARE